MSRSVEVKRDLSVLYTNARSLIPKRDELLAYIDVERPDVVAITETWATSDHLMTEFTILVMKDSTKTNSTGKEEELSAMSRAITLL